ncbi:hypothetical protein [Nonomuraea dietziae]|uniref:hypothetical protein n=1 Tax=Nonomuraea dietziae TaxID=65515 RepID=UPI0031E39275
MCVIVYSRGSPPRWNRGSCWSPGGPRDGDVKRGSAPGGQSALTAPIVSLPEAGLSP